MLKQYIVVYNDNDFVVTGMNATHEEAKEYYVGNYFTFGTCEENEHKKQCVAVFEYSEEKCKKLQRILDNTNRQGFYMVESLNGLNTRIGLVWHNTKETKYGNETVTKEAIDVIQLPKEVGAWLGRFDFEQLAKQLKEENCINEVFVNFETVK